MTVPLNKATPTAVTMAQGELKSIWNNPKSTAILRTAERQEPSMWIVEPIGMTISRISVGTPTRSAASKFTGMVAMLLQVARAVIAAGMILGQKILKPFM